MRTKPGKEWLQLPRWLHKAYANSCGYFWLPCPRCDRKFGGHEKGWGIPQHWSLGGFKGLCPLCVVILTEEHEAGNDEYNKYWMNKLDKKLDLRWDPPEVYRS